MCRAKKRRKCFSQRSNDAGAKRAACKMQAVAYFRY